jgi:hypothetical protein
MFLLCNKQEALRVGDQNSLVSTRLHHGAHPTTRKCNMTMQMCAQGSAIYLPYVYTHVYKTPSTCSNVLHIQQAPGPTYTNPSDKALSDRKLALQAVCKGTRHVQPTEGTLRTCTTGNMGGAT